MAKKKKKEKHHNQPSNAAPLYDAPPPGPPAQDWMDGAFSDDPLGEQTQPGDYC
jgi:hypothetical protein